MHSVFHDLAHLVVVEAFALGHHQRGRETVIVQPLEGSIASTSQIGASQIAKGFTFEGIELQVHLGLGRFGGDALDEVGLLVRS